MTKKFTILTASISALICLNSCSVSKAAETKTAETIKHVSAPSSKKTYKVKSTLHGKASWYSVKTNFGTQTASGQRLRNDAYTAAHKTLPLGTKVRVTNLRNQKSEVLTINDRGPYIHGRIIDVTIGSARRLGFYDQGVTNVKVEVVSPNS